MQNRKQPSLRRVSSSHSSPGGHSRAQPVAEIPPVGRRSPASASAEPPSAPARGFDAFGLVPELERAIADLGFTEPTPIQRSGIPPALAGRDVLACAMTGSGKTAAFVLPILQRLIGKPRGTTRVLVLAPTRELAAQIVEHTNALAKHTGLRAAAVHGGVAMQPQERAFRAGVDVIVACPGRLLDHMQHAYAKLGGLEVLVLDEADRMLDMGFLPDIRRVLAQLPQVEQTMLFSATMPPEIVGLARQLLDAPAVLDVERPSAPATGVTQAIYEVRHELKPHLLLGLLESGAIENALVFTRTKHRANRLADFLLRRGVACERIHGNRSQAARTKALDGFKSGRYRVLVATDVAARGIDVEALSHVINFDVPKVPEDYIHRVGRTARAGATGDAFTFASREEHDELRAIERRVGKPLPRRRLEGFDYENKPAERFEIPVGERIAAHRARKSEDRARAQARQQRATHGSGSPARPPSRDAHPPRGGVRARAGRPTFSAQATGTGTGTSSPGQPSTSGQPSPPPGDRSRAIAQTFAPGARRRRLR